MSSQIIINNSDIIPNFFYSEQAGLYASLALIGRVVLLCGLDVYMLLLR
jgi:hypothetical protein